MAWRDLRIPVVLLVLLVSLSAFWGVRWLYNRYSIEEPLARYLESSQLVQSFEINRRWQVVRVTVNLAPAENLKDTYREITQGIQAVLDGRPFELQLQDNRDEQLKRAFYYSQFAVYEAITKGNYREMIKDVDQRAKEIGASAYVFLDQDRVYLQMKRNGHYLYEVIPRRLDQK